MKYLNGKQTVQSMRSSGYRSTDYAVAELIDNALQAGAPDVVIAVVERTSLTTKRSTTKADEIWVLDNGEGMGPDLAEAAVSFGGSGRYDDRSGMGRFGMGLPQASVSQCKRTDLWTWQGSDPRSAVTVRLDLSEIEAGIDEVPPAVKPGDGGYEPLPDWVLDTYENHMARTVVAGQETTPSGTAVRWSSLDRVQWTKGDTIVGHVERLLGRLYRRFIGPDGAMQQRLQIIVVDGDQLDKGGTVSLDPRPVRPNDPLHLSIPKGDVLEYFEKGNPDYAPEATAEENRDEDGEVIEPLIRVEDRPAFKEHHPTKTFTLIGADGKPHPVEVRTARVTDEGRPATVRNAGLKTHQGRHFARNRGVSIMRADREVCMDETYYYDAPDRFWSVEVSFPPALDEVFGVTNNKQDVPHFKELCKAIARRGEDGDAGDVAEQVSMLQAGDVDDAHSFAQLEQVAAYVLTQVRAMRTENRTEQDARRRNVKRRVGKAATATVHTTLKVKRELAGQQPTRGEQEARKDEALPPEDQQKAREARAKAAEQAAIDNGVDEDDARAVAQNYLKGLTYQIVETPQKQAPAFFWPDEYGDLEVVFMNTAHPVHTALLDVLRLEDDKIDALSEHEAKVLLAQATDALGWLIHGWVRMEDSHAGMPTAEGIRTAREQWGVHLRGILTSKSYSADRADADMLFADDGDEA